MKKPYYEKYKIGKNGLHPNRTNDRLELRFFMKNMFTYSDFIAFLKLDLEVGK